MGVPQGPCGVLNAKARQIEANHVLFGLWTVQFDFNRHYDKHAAPRASVRINVYPHVQLQLASSSAGTSRSSRAGYCGSSSRSVSSSSCWIAQLRYHLRSAGMTYHGAASVSQRASASW